MMVRGVFARSILSVGRCGHDIPARFRSSRPYRYGGQLSSNVRALREASGLKQSAFWKKFGVTQSGGSRYENERGMPTPLRLLMQAWLDKLIDDAALAKLSGKVTKLG